MICDHRIALSSSAQNAEYRSYVRRHKNQMKLIVVISFILVIVGCQPTQPGERKPSLLSNFIKTTDEEGAGIDSLLYYYGGQCLFSTGYYFSTAEKNKRYFGLKLSNSEILNSRQGKFNIPASHIAFLFNRELANAEKRYDQIKVVIETKDGKTHSYEYSIEQLDLVLSKQEFLNEKIKMLSDGKYTEYINLINPEAQMGQMDRDPLLLSMHQTDSIFGSINKMNPFMFLGFSEIANKPDLLRLYGVTHRSIKDCRFRMDIKKEQVDEYFEEFDYDH